MFSKLVSEKISDLRIEIQKQQIDVFGGTNWKPQERWISVDGVPRANLVYLELQTEKEAQPIEELDRQKMKLGEEAQSKLPGAEQKLGPNAWG